MSPDFKQFLKTISPELKQALKRLPGIVKVEGLDFIHDNFENHGFENSPGSYTKWKERSKNGQKKNQGRAILVKTGNLQRSWDQGADAGTSRVVFSSDKPYAQIHNEGGSISKGSMSRTYTQNRSKNGKYSKGTKAGRGSTIKGHSITMPQRQMIGDSKALDARIETKITSLMDSVFKS